MSISQPLKFSLRHLVSGQDSRCLSYLSDVLSLLQVCVQCQPMLRRPLLLPYGQAHPSKHCRTWEQGVGNAERAWPLPLGTGLYTLLDGLDAFSPL